MVSSELNTSNPVDFKSIGKKFQSGENLNDSEKDAVFSLGLDYTHGLIESKKGSLYGYDDQTQAVKDHFTVIILGRIIHLHQNADKTITDATKAPESIKRFGELKGLVCEKLFIKAEDLPDDKLNAFFDKNANLYMDKKFNDEVTQSLPFIRKILTSVVADNPSKVNDREVFLLD